MRISPLANDYVVVFTSPSPSDLYCYSPGLARMSSGRLVASMDLGGPGTTRLTGPRSDGGDCPSGNIGKCFLSDDQGATWRHVVDFPFYHARPFVAGKALYLLGHGGDLRIMRSDDEGETWSEPVTFTHDQRWHQAPCNVWYAHGKVYLVMERYTQPWGWHSLAPVVMAARVDDDLTLRASWTFSDEFIYAERVRPPYGIGAPFFTPGPTDPDNPRDRRDMAPVGWLEANIVQFADPGHVWHDPHGKTFHIFCRAHTGSTNIAMLAKAVEADDGSISVSLEQSPAGEDMFILPMPGGHMKFHMIFDEPSNLFWLLSTQATDSMVWPKSLPPDRFNLPNNERRRLQLHFFKNGLDWCFAGLVAVGETEVASRHYASMAVDGNDLAILSRSGDRHAISPHNGNLITFHKVRDFRELVYYFFLQIFYVGHYGDAISHSLRLSSPDACSVWERLVVPFGGTGGSERS